MPPKVKERPRFSPKAGFVNIRAPSGPPPQSKKDGPAVPLVCMEDGCGWTAEGFYSTARYHVKTAHAGRPTHVFAVRTQQQEAEAREKAKARKREGMAAMRKRQRLANTSVGGDNASDEGSEGEQLPVQRRLVYFAVETDESAGTGNVHSIICHVRPKETHTTSGSSSSICDGSMVLATLGAEGEGAFHVAMSWLVGLVQAGVLGEAGLRLDRVDRRHRLLWKSEEQLVVSISHCSASVDGESLGVAAALALLSLVVEDKKPDGDDEDDEEEDDDY